MGAEVICLHDRPDGDRINVHCGSTHLVLSRLLSSSTQLFGFAFDGDADRVLAVMTKDDQLMGITSSTLGSDLRSGATVAWKLNCIYCNG